MNQTLRVWWIPQVPGKPFYADVQTVEEGVRLMDILGEYDQFQLDNNIKPGYCNVGGLQIFSSEDNDWIDWYDEESGEDDPYNFLAEKHGV